MTASPMSSGRWQKINNLFHEAVNRDPEERAVFLADACGEDLELLADVERLVSSHERAGEFIQPRHLAQIMELLPDRELLPVQGQQFGNYKILQELGRGGMGAVYLAERADDQFEKYVAIKIIKRGMDTDAVVRHFQIERQILASLEHPNIARLLDASTTESGVPYFIMEYIDGLPIDVYCDRSSLSLTERLKLFREICAAVSYAHRHLVVHRDLKPSNILVTSDGMPKLLDFGIAKILEPGRDTPKTTTGLHLMTPEYASPEQARGLPVTTVSDVYSLGVVLYELLTGQLPYRFKSLSTNDILQAISSSHAPRPSTVVHKLDTGNSTDQRKTTNSPSRTRGDVSRITGRQLRGDLDNVVLKAISKEPERRYQSVEQLSEDVQRHLDGLPVSARKDTFTYRVTKFVGRNRTAVAIAAFLILSLGIGVFATVWQAKKARVAQQRAERRFNDVRKLANAVLFDYHDAIRNLPGSTPVRERLVKDALVYLDSLAGEAADDPGLQRELAFAYDRVGDVLGAPHGANLGDRAGAMESYLKAMRIREALLAADPKDLKSLRDLAESHRNIGWQLTGTNETAAGLEHLRQAVMLYEQAVTKQPADREVRRGLARAYDSVGSALEDRGDLVGALENERHAVLLLEEMLAATPNEKSLRRSLSIAHENIGRSLFLKGDLSAALESNSKALALRNALYSEDPTNTDYRRMLAISYQNDADFRMQSGDKLGAMESFLRKLSIDKELLAADPANKQSYGDCAYSSLRLGDLAFELGDNIKALSYYQTAVEMYQQSTKSGPEDLSSLLNLAVSRSGVSRSQALLRNYAAASDECNNAKALLDRALDDPANADQRGVKAQTYSYLGQAYSILASSKGSARAVKNQHLLFAHEMYEHSLNIWDDMGARGILSASDATRPAEVKKALSKVDAALASLANR